MTLRSCSTQGVETLTLDLPPVNALDIGVITELEAYFSDYSGELPLVITGTGRAFSAGVDTKAYNNYSMAERSQLFAAITRMVSACCSIPSPVIAAVNGHALGGGLVLCLCTDYRLVAEGHHKFGLTEAAAGVPFPDGPQAIIKHEIPNALLRKLTLSSSIISSDELIRFGVFDEVVDANILAELAQQRALTLAEQPAFATVKQQIRGELSNTLRSMK